MNNYYSIPLTKKQIEGYLEEPDKCPVCQSGNLTGDEGEWTSDFVWRFIKCNNCNHRWTEEFKLLKIMDLEKIIEE